MGLLIMLLFVAFLSLYLFIDCFYHLVLHIFVDKFTYKDDCSRETFRDEISGNEQLVWSPNKVTFAALDTVIYITFN